MQRVLLCIVILGWYHDLFVDAVRRTGGMTPNDSRSDYNEVCRMRKEAVAT